MSVRKSNPLPLRNQMTYDCSHCMAWLDQLEDRNVPGSGWYQQNFTLFLSWAWRNLGGCWGLVSPVVCSIYDQVETACRHTVARPPVLPPVAAAIASWRTTVYTLVYLH